MLTVALRSLVCVKKSSLNCEVWPPDNWWSVHTCVIIQNVRN